MNRDVEVAIELAVSAGKKILEIYDSKFEISLKEDKSPLTDADKAANRIIVEGLKKEFPDHALLSEEMQDDLSRLESEYCWLVDQLDGTKEFINKNGEFTVNIALVKDGHPKIGVVYIPVTDELFFAKQGMGAFHRKKCVDQTISTSKRTSNLTILVSRSHRSEALDRLIEQNRDKIGDVKEAGSSLKGCFIAKGNADVYYRCGPTREWDTAAMHCIVEEAGGIVNQIDDTRLIYNKRNTLNEKGFYVINRMENKLI